MANVSTTTQIETIKFWGTTPPSIAKELWSEAPFDFRTPAGSQDALINKVIVGDLVVSAYDGNGLWRKLDNADTLATVNDVMLGFVTELWLDQKKTENRSYVGNNTLADTTAGHTFTADGGLLKIYSGINPEYPIDPRKIYIHLNTTPNTRVNLWGTAGANFVTYCTGSGILSGRIQLYSSNSNNPLILLK